MVGEEFWFKMLLDFMAYFEVSCFYMYLAFLIDQITSSCYVSKVLGFLPFKRTFKKPDVGNFKPRRLALKTSFADLCSSIKVQVYGWFNLEEGEGGPFS